MPPPVRIDPHHPPGWRRPARPAARCARPSGGRAAPPRRTGPSGQTPAARSSTAESGTISPPGLAMREALLRGVRGWRTARPGPGDRPWRTGTGLADPGPAAGHGDGEGGPACRATQGAGAPPRAGRAPAPASASLGEAAPAVSCRRVRSCVCASRPAWPDSARPASSGAVPASLQGPPRRAGASGRRAAARRPCRLAGSPPDSAASRCGDGGRRAWTPARRHSRATRTRPPGRPRAPVPRLGPDPQRAVDSTPG